MSPVYLTCSKAISNDFQGLSCHADGLKRVVALRGGMDSLGMGEYMKTRVAQYFLLPLKCPSSEPTD